MEMIPHERGRVATVGTFDGLHRGHRRVISALKAEASKRGLEPLVIGFDRHPLETIAPERAPRLIQSPSERTNMLYREGLSLLTLEFTHELASLSAAEWLRKMHDEQRVEVLIVGYDNTFGHDGTSMSIADYVKLGKTIGVEVLEAPYEPHASSSAVRRLIASGDIQGANALLGRHFTIYGTVTEGKKLGRTLGYPTANISPSYRALLPASGVYAVDVEMPDGNVRRGVANVGTQPTMAKAAPVRVEVHVPGFSGNLYGERLGARFLARLRDEIKFSGPDELRRQIEEDVEATDNL